MDFAQDEQDEHGEPPEERGESVGAVFALYFTLGMAFFLMGARRNRRAIQVWRLASTKQRTIVCMLKEGADNRFVLAVTLDGGEIAARRYYTRTEAISHAGFLLERLTAAGWSVVAGMPPASLH